MVLLIWLFFIWPDVTATFAPSPDMPGATRMTIDLLAGGGQVGMVLRANVPLDGVAGDGTLGTHCVAALIEPEGQAADIWVVCGADMDVSHTQTIVLDLPPSVTEVRLEVQAGAIRQETVYALPPPPPPVYEVFAPYLEAAP